MTVVVQNDNAFDALSEPLTCPAIALATADEND